MIGAAATTPETVARILSALLSEPNASAERIRMNESRGTSDLREVIRAALDAAGYADLLAALQTCEDFLSLCMATGSNATENVKSAPSLIDVRLKARTALAQARGE